MILCKLTRSASSLAALAAVMCLPPVLYAQAVESVGTVDAVTVYRGQALVSRLVDIPGGVGLREVVVTGLPEFLIPASLYAESTDGLEVRSVSYRVRPVPEDAREGVRKLEQQIRAVQDQLDAGAGKTRLMDWQRQYLDKLETYLSGTAVVENNKGVLNADTITKMTDLITSQRSKLNDDGQKLAISSRELAEQMGLLQRELATLSAKSSRTAREALVFVNQTRAGSKLRLNYLVDRANWSPSYNLRASAAGSAGTAGVPGASDQVSVEYQASIQQMSGEDWGNVTMTLSTATPALVASGPSLQPLTIALAPPGGGGGKSVATGALADALAMKDRSYAEVRKELAVKQRELEQNRNVQVLNAPVGQTQIAGLAGGDQEAAGQSFGAAALAGFDDQADKSLNDLAVRAQLFDVITSEKFERKIARISALEPKSDEGVSVTYTIAGRTSLPSRADQQLIQIAKIAAPAKFAKVATPALTAYVYNQAVVTNSGELVLLAGPAASYVGGEFVGRGRVPTVSAGETFSAGFGIDSSLRSSRELVERTETIQGGNRVVEFTYKLGIENFGKQPAAVRLVDRVPQPKGTDIRLTLVSTGKDDQPLSKDAAYEANEKKNGLLRWDVTAPAGATGTGAYGLEYRFRLEFDKQMTITEGAAK